VGCSTRTVVDPGADGGRSGPEAGTEDGGGLADGSLDAMDRPDGGGPPDAFPDLGPLPDPITIRIADGVLAPLEAQVRVVTDAGTRAVTGDRVTLSGDELRARADVIVAAPGFAPIALSTFRREDYAALPELEGAPAIALVPRFVTDPIEVRLGDAFGGTRIATDPLGYGGGVLRPDVPTEVERDPAVRALLLEGFGDMPCPMRLPVPDLTTLEGPIVVRTDDPAIEAVDCLERTIEVAAPAGRFPTLVDASYAIPFFAVGYGLGRATTISRFFGSQSFVDDGDREEVVDFVVRLLPESITTRDHPALRRTTEPVIGGFFNGPGIPADSSEVRYDAFESIPERVQLPEPPPEPEFTRVRGLEFEIGSFDRPELLSLPATITLDPPPEDGRSVFVGFARSGVLLPPGAAELPLERVVRNLEALEGPDVILRPQDEVYLLVVGLVRVTYEPFAARNGFEFTAVELGGGRLAGFIGIPRELVETDK
ncbi:MAG: hypothetical protein AAGH15_14410, partial [Myxococcota bacterium]